MIFPTPMQRRKNKAALIPPPTLPSVTHVSTHPLRKQPSSSRFVAVRGGRRHQPVSLSLRVVPCGGVHERLPSPDRVIAQLPEKKQIHVNGTIGRSLVGSSGGGGSVVMPTPAATVMPAATTAVPTTALEDESIPETVILNKTPSLVEESAGRIRSALTALSSSVYFTGTPNYNTNTPLLMTSRQKRSRSQDRITPPLSPPDIPPTQVITISKRPRRLTDAPGGTPLTVGPSARLEPPSTMSALLLTTPEFSSPPVIMPVSRDRIISPAKDWIQGVKALLPAEENKAAKLEGIPKALFWAFEVLLPPNKFWDSVTKKLQLMIKFRGFSPLVFTLRLAMAADVAFKEYSSCLEGRASSETDPRMKKMIEAEVTLLKTFVRRTPTLWIAAAAKEFAQTDGGKMSAAAFLRGHSRPPPPSDLIAAVEYIREVMDESQNSASRAISQDDTKTTTNACYAAKSACELSFGNHTEYSTSLSEKIEIMAQEEQRIIHKIKDKIIEAEEEAELLKRKTRRISVLLDLYDQETAVIPSLRESCLERIKVRSQRGLDQLSRLSDGLPKPHNIIVENASRASLLLWAAADRQVEQSAARRRSSSGLPTFRFKTY